MEKKPAPGVMPPNSDEVGCDDAGKPKPVKAGGREEDDVAEEDAPNTPSGLPAPAPRPAPNENGVDPNPAPNVGAGAEDVVADAVVAVDVDAS